MLARWRVLCAAALLVLLLCGGDSRAEAQPRPATQANEAPATQPLPQSKVASDSSAAATAAPSSTSAASSSGSSVAGIPAVSTLFDLLPLLRTADADATPAVDAANRAERAAREAADAARAAADALKAQTETLNEYKEQDEKALKKQTEVLKRAEEVRAKKQQEGTQKQQAAERKLKEQRELEQAEKKKAAEIVQAKEEAQKKEADAKAAEEQKRKRESELGDLRTKLDAALKGLSQLQEQTKRDASSNAASAAQRSLNLKRDAELEAQATDDIDKLRKMIEEAQKQRAAASKQVEKAELEKLAKEQTEKNLETQKAQVQAQRSQLDALKKQMADEAAAKELEKKKLDEAIRLQKLKAEEDAKQREKELQQTKDMLSQLTQAEKERMQSQINAAKQRELEAEKRRVEAEQNLKKVEESEAKKTDEERKKADQQIEQSKKAQDQLTQKAMEEREKLKQAKEKEHEALMAKAEAERRALAEKTAEEEGKRKAKAESDQKNATEALEKSKAAAAERTKAEAAEKSAQADERRLKTEQVEKQSISEAGEKQTKQESERKTEVTQKTEVKIAEARSKEDATKKSLSAEAKTKAAAAEEEKEKAQLAQEAAEKKVDESNVKQKMKTESAEKQERAKSLEAATKAEAAAEQATKKDAADVLQAKQEAAVKVAQTKVSEAATKAELAKTKEEEEKAKLREEGEKKIAQVKAEEKEKEAKTQEKATKQKEEQATKQEETTKRTKAEQSSKEQIGKQKEEAEKAQVAEAVAKRQSMAEAEEKLKKKKEEDQKRKAQVQQQQEADSKAKAKAEEEQKAKAKEEKEKEVSQEERGKKDLAAEQETKKEQQRVRAQQEAAERAAAEQREKNGYVVPLKADKVESYGHSYAVPAFKRVGQLCFVFGVAFAKDFRDVLATLPEGCRPDGRLIAQSHLQHMVTFRADMFPDGRIAYVTGGGALQNGMFSFSPLVFFVAGSDVRDVRLVSQNWRPFGEGYMDPVFYVQDDMCVVSGVVRRVDGASWSNHIGNLPDECRPRDGRLIFSTNYNDYVARLDVFANGEVHYVGSAVGGAYPWLSLQGIHFFTVSDVPLDLASGFGIYRNSYRAPSMRREGAICALSGLLTGNSKGLVTTLDKDCWPHQRQIFYVVRGHVTQRIDVTADGRVVWIEGPDDQVGWLPLDGITFLVGMRKVEDNKIVNMNFTEVPLVPASGWRAFENGYRAPVAQAFGQFCLLSGMVITDSISTFKGEIVTLPDICRTDGRRRAFDLHGAGTAPVRVDLVDQTVRWTAGATGKWLSLDAIFFPVRTARLVSLLLTSPYVNFGANNYENATYFVHEGLCMVGGFIRHKDFAELPGGEIGKLPKECTPDGGQLIFQVNHGAYSHRVDVAGSGAVLWIAGEKAMNYLSLQGIAFSTAVPDTPLQLLNGWSAYRGAFRIPSLRMHRSLCVLSGLLNGAGRAHIATLPDYCRPAKRLVFAVNHHVYAARLDILPDGRVFYADGVRQYSWVSLDGVRFISDAPKAQMPKVYSESEPEVAKIPLADGVQQASGFATASYARHGQLCTLQGRVEPFSIRERIFATLPADCRPPAHLIFGTAFNEANLARLDVAANGEIRHAGGSTYSRWVSFDGLQFAVRSTQFMPVALEELWVPYNREDYGAPGYVRQGMYCLLTGVARTDNWNTNAWAPNVFRLPQECAPSDGRLLMHVNHHEFAHRLDVLPSGQGVWVHGRVMHAWLSLDGVAFFIESNSRPLSLLNGWAAYNGAGKDGGYRIPSYAKHGSLCALSGLMRNNGGEVIAMLPPECRPTGRASFNVILWSNGEQQNGVVEINPSNGALSYVLGKRPVSWFSLDGIRFVASRHTQVNGPLTTTSTAGTALELAEGFQAFHHDGALYRNPLYKRLGSLCLLSGVGSSPNIRSRMATLPEECRPKARHVFDSHNLGARTLRVDVLANGDVRWVAGNTDGNWISLDGVLFSVAPASDGVPLQLENGYVPFGDEYAAPVFHREGKDGDIIVVSGVISTRNGANVGSNLLFTLPSDARPDAHLVMSVNQNENTQTVYLYNNGEAVHRAGVLTYPWISLDGLVFFMRGYESLPLLNGFGIYRNGYRPPSFRKEGELCMVSGLASGAAQAAIGLLPEECRPEERLIFAVDNHGSSVRLDVLPDGRILWVDVPIKHNWISLDGIRFVVSRTRERGVVPVVKPIESFKRVAMTLESDLSPYQRGFLAPTEFQGGGFCMLGGRVRGGDMRTQYAVLSPECRPRHRIMLDQHVDGTQTWRVDILPDGVVTFVASSATGSVSWVTFDGIFFPVASSRGEPVLLQAAWQAFGHGYETPSWIKTGEVCMVYGVARPMSQVSNNDWSSNIALLPSECRPAGGRVIFGLNNNQYTWRVDVLPSGEVWWDKSSVSGIDVSYNNFLSLSGITFATISGTPLQLAASWTNYQNGFRQAQYAAQHELCVLSGLVRNPNGGGAQTVVHLPSECVPLQRQTFWLNNHANTHQYDVVPSSDGKSATLEFVFGARNQDWISLDGARFVRRV